ncbi:MAG: hypothetical protein RMY29_026305 [Nostoc sp. CreGUA01]|nr:hypothetical protein [Nostoc sp. CreGUA01]
MSESIEPNVTKAEESFVEEEMAETNESETNENDLNEPTNPLIEKGKSKVLAGGTGHPTPPIPEMSPEVIV